MTHFISILEKNSVDFAERIAVKTKTGTLTYREFNQRINQYANFLQQQATNSDLKQPRIAIVYHRSLDMLLWMLAAWKVNASFMLIDSGDLQQAGSVKTKLDQINPQFIVTSKQFENHPEFSRYPSFIYTDDANTQNKINSQDKQFTFQCPPDNTEAYVITTSGSSTGVAKFVIVNHTLAPGSGVSALFYDISKLMNLGEGDTVLIDGAVNWDPNICLIGVGLYHGAAIYIAPPEQTRNRHSLLLDCINDRVNVMLVLPSAYKDLERERDLLELMRSNNLRLIFTGEALTKIIVDCFKSYATGGIYNGYGPSEGPIGITATKVDGSDNISIHRAMQGRQYAIVDSQGIESNNGELIWKAQGFGGYLGNAEETNKKLILYKGENWYRSGDLVEKNGEKLSFLVRADKQFKVMTILFNPEPIGPFLENTFPGTQAHAMGVISPFTGTKIPAVFYKSKVSAAELKSAVEKVQTAPMIKFIRLEDSEEFPRTGNGKIDEKALEKKYIEYVTRDMPNATDVKENLRKIWCETLEIPKITDENTSFYHSGNGSSIQFNGLKLALSNNKVIKKLININEISSKVQTLTFKELVELASQTSRANYVTYVDPEKVDYPVIIIDGDLSEDYREIAPNSPIVILQPSNPKDTPENKLLDAHKTIKQVGIEGPYFVVQVFWDDVYAWGYWENLPSQFYFLKNNICNKAQLTKGLYDEIKYTTERDLKLKLDPTVKLDVFSGLRSETKPTETKVQGSLFDLRDKLWKSGLSLLVINDQTNIQQELIQHGVFRKHLNRLSNSNLAIIVTIESEKPDLDDIRSQLEVLGLGCQNLYFLYNNTDYPFPTFSNNLFFTSKRVRPQREYDAITTFYNADRNEAPLILFAPFTGEDVYEKFCEKISIPCIVLRHPLLAKERHSFPTSFESLADLAKFYAEVVLHLVPKGDINLAGWSFGGVVAVAVAQELERKLWVKKAEYVGIIDSTAPYYLSPNLLLDRILWILNTYSIPHDDNAISKMSVDDPEKSWRILRELVEQAPKLINRDYILKIITICREHYYFGFEHLWMPTQKPFHLYTARNLGESEPKHFLSFRHHEVPADNSETLGWWLKPCVIFGTDHFSILQSLELVSEIFTDCKSYTLCDVKICESLKELAISQVPRLLKRIENLELQRIIEHQSFEENSVILQENTPDKLMMGLQLLSETLTMYLSDPAKNYLPIYIDLKEYSVNSFDTFFYKLNLSATQPHAIDEMRIIFIVDNVDQVPAIDLIKSIQNSPIDLNRHPVIWLCEKEHYQQNEILHEHLKQCHTVNSLTIPNI